MEDTLKHFYNSEYRGRTPTFESLSGSLGVSGRRAAELLAKAEAMKLVRREEGELQLTSEGRNQALQILHVHRLWENYLAEETGLAEVEWHGEADRREHQISEKEADELPELMGHPAYDPYVDPIPTGSGDIAPSQGVPLPSLSAGDRAVLLDHALYDLQRNRECEVDSYFRAPSRWDGLGNLLCRSSGLETVYRMMGSRQILQPSIRISGNLNLWSHSC